MYVDLTTPTRFEHSHESATNTVLVLLHAFCLTLTQQPGSGRREDTCFSRVDQGPLTVVGACIGIEEHHVVFHVSGILVLQVFLLRREGEIEGGREEGASERGRGVREGGKE